VYLSALYFFAFTWFLLLKITLFNTAHTVIKRGGWTLWFSDEKVFTVANLTNLQNNRINSYAAKKALIPTSRLISEREHFSSTYDIA